MGRAQFDHADFVAAARALTAERGPVAVTVDSIIERLKAPKGSFYYRFASRDVLLGELWLATVLAYQEGFVAAIEAGDGLAAALHTPARARLHLDDAKIKDARLEADRATVNAALDRIEQQRQGRAYLVADAFTVADLTAAAMLSPILQPPEIQYPLRVELPAYMQDYRAALLQHPAVQWAAGIYRLHRGHSAEVSRRAAAA
jgi:AcrR family transcriptional regulator